MAETDIPIQPDDLAKLEEIGWQWNEDAWCLDV